VLDLVAIPSVPSAGGGERHEHVVPQGLDVCAQRRQARRIGVIDVSSSPLPVSHQSGALEDGEVLGHRGPADRHVRGQLGDRGRPLADEFEDRPPRLLGERVQGGFVSSP
jgi:hypothetical protein